MFDVFVKERETKWNGNPKIVAGVTWCEALAISIGLRTFYSRGHSMMVLANPIFHRILTKLTILVVEILSSVQKSTPFSVLP